MGLSGLRVLWASAGAHLRTGYGRVTRYVLRIFRGAGIDVIAFNSQLLGGVAEIGGVLNLPRGSDPFGSDVIPMYYRVFNRNLLMTLWDVWVLRWICRAEVNWVPYVPIDAELDEHVSEILEPLRCSQCIAAVAMSRFGYEQLRRFLDVELFMVPHGVDTSVFYPRPRESARGFLGLPRDAFVFGCVAANIGDRKDLPTLLRAFGLFLENNPDARDSYLVLWTCTRPSLGQSFDLARIARRLGIEKRVVVPALQPPNLFYDDEDLAMVYSAMDWYVTASRGEGFGLPLLEAQACGVPCIAPDNSAQRELVEGRGILVPCRYEVYTLTTPTHQVYRAVDPHDLADAMSRAYNSGVPQSLRERCIEFARSLDWSNVARMWIEVMSRIAEMVT